jgi:alpha-ribazole phosphatase
MELNCGQWELQHWDDIPKTEIEPWFDDYVNVAIPNGESYTMLYDRVSTTFQQIAQQHQHESVAIVAHGGVLRSILSYITNTPLVDSFDAFKIHYGAVIAIQPADDKFSFEILSNIAGKTEQHQPSNM